MIDLKNKEALTNEIADIIGLPSHKISNIYLYGSRVYGTADISSDYDFAVTASSMMVNQEFYEGLLNIHVTTPDIFEDRLRKHDIHCLECIWAPDFAKIKIEKKYEEGFKLNIIYLKKMILSQAAGSWVKAKRRTEKGNIIGGAKSLFHSLRILRFGHQIMTLGKMVDFSECNELWEKINGFEELEWSAYNDKWIRMKRQYMKEFKGDIGDPYSINFILRDKFETLEKSQKKLA